jgi:hypothetical protein
LVNHPTYGHAIKAYNELRKRKQKELMRKTARDQESSQANTSPMKFGQRTADSFNMRENNEIRRGEQSNPSQIQPQQFQAPVPPQLNNHYPPNYQPMQNTFVGQPPVQQQVPMQHQGGMFRQHGQQMIQPVPQQGYQGAPQNMGGSYYGGFPNQGYQNQGVYPQKGYSQHVGQ